MKKVVLSLFIGIFLIIALGMFTSSALPDDFNSFIENIVEQRGLNESDIGNITQVDFEDLPEAVSLEDIDNTNLGIYQIEILNGSPVYVITMSDETYSRTKLSENIIDVKRSYLNFGSSKKTDEDGFLETATGVKTSAEKGYVMVRAGNITGISTNLEVKKKDSKGQIEIILYKHGQAVGFGNTLIADVKEVKTDYDIQSEGLGAFNAGDIISVYVNAVGDLEWKDVTTLIEITTTE